MSFSPRINQQQISVISDLSNEVNQLSNTSPRALNAIQSFFSFFEGVWQIIDIRQLIMEDLDFQDLVTLRAVSTVMYNIMQFCIQSKVIISCWLSRVCISDALMKGKMSFIKKENIGFILRIDSVDEIKKFNSNFLIYKDISWSSVQGIDLGDIVSDEFNVKVIGEFFLNLANLGASDFLWLSLGDVSNDLELSDKFKNLEKLHIRSISDSVDLLLPESLFELKSLTIEFIGYDVSILLPVCLDKLETCVIGRLYTPIQFPELPKLKQLSVGGLLVHDDVKKGLVEVKCGALLLPKVLPELEELSIDRIEDHLTFQLSSKLDKLKKLVFGDIGMHVTIQLPTTLDNLTELHMGECLHNRICFEFPVLLPSLRMVSIGSLQKDAIMNFPFLDNLETLIIDQLDASESLKFQDSLLPKFKTLNIRSISWISGSGSFQLPDALANIEELIIESLGHDSTFVLQGCLSRLINLTINKIDYNAKCDLSLALLPNLKNLVLNDISWNHSAIILLPEELNKLSSLHIVGVKKTTQLPHSLNGLTELSIGSLDSPQFQFPSAMNLQHLKIDFLNSQLIIPQLENLKSLIIRSLSLRGYVELQSLPILETFIIGGTCLSSPINLKVSLPSLVHLSIGGLSSYVDCMLPIISNAFNSFACSCSNDKERTMLYSMKNLTHLSMGGLAPGFSLLLPATIGDLCSFSINLVWYCATLELPDMLLTLKELSIGDIWEGATLKLPDSLEALESLKLKNIYNEGVIKYNQSSEAINHDDFISRFLCSMPNLKNLDIEIISRDTSLVLSPLLSNLQRINITLISNNVIFKLISSKKIQNLTTLTLEDIGGGVQVTITGIYDNLTMLTLGSIYSETQVTIAGEYCKLETLVLDKVYGKLTLPDSLNKVKKIVITEIGCPEFEFPSNLDNLTSLEINVGYFSTKLILPKFLPKLSDLTIAGRKAILKQPSFNHAAKSFFIDGVSEDSNIGKLLNSINSALIPPLEIRDQI